MVAEAKIADNSIILIPIYISDYIGIIMRDMREITFTVAPFEFSSNLKTLKFAYKTQITFNLNA